ncbi:MAG: hypothetical protein BVN32_00785 [Proteobacteria bacterium ST_bin14]|nr:MAG: hypothetical protein BVN32_00785 [Proteobacteria bacterium ST_bin14]
MSHGKVSVAQPGAAVAMRTGLRRKLSLLLMAFAAAALPTPAAATVSTTCIGKGSTPEIEIKIGEGIYEVRLGSGRAAQIITSLRQRNNRDNSLDFDILDRSGRVTARVLLRPLNGHGELVGTMVRGGRKYWLRCGELG